MAMYVKNVKKLIVMKILKINKANGYFGLN